MLSHDQVDPWNEPRGLIPQILEHLNPSDDVSLMKEIELLMTNIERTKLTNLDKWTNSFNALLRQHEILSEEYEKELDYRKQWEEALSIELTEIDRSKHITTNKLIDIERQENEHELEIKRLENELNELIQIEKQEQSIPPDETSVKLAICNGLNIEMMEHDEKYIKARILSSTKNEVYNVEFDEHHSYFYYANLLWDMAK